MNSFKKFFDADYIIQNKEIAAYEHLWIQKNASFKSIAELFKSNINKTPSKLVDSHIIQEFFEEALEERLQKLSHTSFGIKINNTMDYPVRLRDAIYPVEMLYFMGNWGLVYGKKTVSVVGSRKPSPEGISRTKKLVKLLVEDGYTIISGLATGVDTAAHQTAISMGGNTIAVIGTPIDEYYPKQNKALQDKIANDHLLISQIPFERYSRQNYKSNRFFFPERNATMSALSQATIIVEAGETSGTLTQARAAIQQGRKLFILENNFQNPKITWPEKYKAKGALSIKTYSDFIRNMEGIHASK